MATGAAIGGLWLLDETGETAELIHSEGYSEAGRQGFRRIRLGGSLELPILDVFRGQGSALTPDP